MTLLDGPFTSARAGTLRDILPGDRYRAGVAVTMSTFMAAMVAGYAAGGILVAAIGARPSLLLDAATYLVSAAGHPAGGRGPPGRPAARRRTAPAQALTLVFGEPAAAHLHAVRLAGRGVHGAVLRWRSRPRRAWAAARPRPAWCSPRARSAPPRAPLVYHRAGAARQARWMGPLAVLCCASLALFAARPGLAGSLVIITGSGAFGSFQVAANAGFMAALRRDQQAQAFGVAQAGMATVQGLSYLAAGAAAGAAPPAVVIAAWGIAGAAAALALAVSWRPYAQAALAAEDPAATAVAVADDPA